MKTTSHIQQLATVCILLSGCAYSNALQAQSIDWLVTATGNGFDFIEDVASDDQGFIYACGKLNGKMYFADTTLTSNGLSDIFVMKYDSNGVRQWIITDGGDNNDYAVELDVDAAGNVYVGGRFIDTTNLGGTQYISSSEGFADIFIMKLDANGTHQWTKQFSGPKNDRVRGLAVDPAGNVYFTGRYRNSCTFGPYTLTSINTDDIMVVKLDTDGNVIWAIDCGGPKLDFGEAITRANDGSIYITGSFFQWGAFGDSTLGTDTVILSNGDEEGFLAKYDSDGNFHWALNLGGNLRDYGEDLTTDEFSNVIASGGFSDVVQFGAYTATGADKLDLYVSKWSPDGECLWVNFAGSTVSLDVVWGSDYDGKGNTYVTGFYRGPMTWGSFFLDSEDHVYSMFATKIGPGGDVIWARKMGDYDSYDLGRGLACDINGNPYVGGAIQDTAYYDSFYVETAGGYDLIFARLDPGDDSCGIANVDAEVNGCTDSTYFVDITISYYDAPSTGDLIVNGEAFPITGSPQTLTLEYPLDPTGSPVDIIAYFSAEPDCDLSYFGAFNALQVCEGCAIIDVDLDQVLDCDPVSLTYGIVVSVEYQEPPVTGSLDVNGVVVPITGSPQQVTINNIPLDGNPVAINAFFTGDPSCTAFSDPSLLISETDCNVCLVPTGLFVNLDTSNLARALLNFNAVPNAFKYEIQGGKLGLGIGGTVTSPVNQKVINLLTPNTKYRWQVRALCPMDTSAFSLPDTFTSLSTELGLFDFESGARLYPTPADEWSWLELISEIDREISITIYNTAGALIRREEAFLPIGTSYIRLDVEQFPSGQYYVEISDALRRRTLSLPINH